VVDSHNQILLYEVEVVVNPNNRNHLLVVFVSVVDTYHSHLHTLAVTARNLYVHLLVVAVVVYAQPFDHN
jgi:hypothetical protein